MIVEIDHVLVAVPDPDAAAVHLAALLGLPPAGGGMHPAIGTRNALLSLGGPYVELIGLVDGTAEVATRADAHPIGAAVRAALRDEEAGIAAGRAAPRPQQVGAYAAVALRTDDLDTDLRRLRTAGSGLAADVVRRARPDGSVVTWPVAFPPRLGPDEPGFLIEHTSGEPERAARLATAGPRLAGLVVSVPDPGAVAAAWRSTLGIRFTRSRPERPDRPRDLVATIGPHAVVLRAMAAADDKARLATILLADPAGSADPIALGSVVFAWR